MNVITTMACRQNPTNSPLHRPINSRENCLMDSSQTLWIMENPQIYKGDPRPRIPPCAMVLSAMWLKLGYSGFCRPHTETNANKMCAAFHVSRI